MSLTVSEYTGQPNQLLVVLAIIWTARQEVTK